MKKLFCLFLSCLLVLSLAACGGDTSGSGTSTTEPAALPALQAGYSKVCITPEKPLPLSSTDQATYTAVYDDVYLTCIALTDANNETVLLFTTDISYCPEKIQLPLKRKAEEATGIPIERMFFSVTHNHSGLDPTGDALTILEEAMFEASAAAMADRSAATLSMGTTKTENLNFVRHYYTEDGYWVGDNYYSPTGSKSTANERDADPTVQLLRFDREGKDSVLLMNWQAHGNYSYKMEYLCADFVGPLRTAVEEQTGCLFAYFQGAAGNLNPRREGLENNIAERSLDGMTVYGKTVAQYVIDAMGSLTPVNGEGIGIVSSAKTIKVRWDNPEIVMAAGQYRDTREAGGSHAEAVVASGNLIHSDQGVEYVSHRSRNSGTKEADLTVFRLGDVAFVVAPYEMFDDSGVYIRENSPFAMTFILAYTNGRLGYIPTKACVEHGCYEHECGQYEAGTAELLAEEYVALLKQLHSGS